MRRLLAFVALLATLLAALPAWAHKPSDSYLTLNVSGDRLHGRWDVALRDLAYAMELDDGDGKLTWAEVSSRQADVAAYVLPRLAVKGCALSPGPLSIASHSDGTYAVIEFEGTCAAEVTALAVDYRLLFDVDAQHRGLLRVESGGQTLTHVFSAKAPSASFDLARPETARQLGVIVKEGVAHIWTGYDHVLFLVALLLPSVLRRQNGAWVPVPSLRSALLDVVRIVTAFTVAHSITLSLAALGVVTLPSRLVESTIAASVVLAALNNLWPLLREDRWTAAFLLGLMHGFGFSATLTDLDLPRSNLVATLFGFNLGVEIGQLAIVAVFVPLAFAVRTRALYRRGFVAAGSAGILVLATVWFVERAFLLKILP